MFLIRAKCFLFSLLIYLSIYWDKNPHTRADWHSALLKLSVRRKIMCIPIIYISCVKILRMYSVKNSFMLMVFSCFHMVAASVASSTASWQHDEDREKAVSTVFVNSSSTVFKSQHHLIKSTWQCFSGNMNHLNNCKATVDVEICL